MRLKLKILVLLLVSVITLSLSSWKQGSIPPSAGGVGREGMTRVPSLFVSHAALDPRNGDLLIISNSWPNELPILRRFHADGTPDTSFSLQRFENCCAIYPSLVATDPEGNIYTLEYRGDLHGFFLYKHAPSGELDIDWGETVTASTGSASATSGGYESGETVLTGTAGGGRLEVPLVNPVDLVARSDGSLLILDSALKYVYMVDPEGKSVTEFIGAQGYIPRQPVKLLSDKEGYLYLVDYYDPLDIIRRGMVGVFKFTPEGMLIEGWGEDAGGINDPYHPTWDINTLVVDGKGALYILGGEPRTANHAQVFVFDGATGNEISRTLVQYLQGPDSNYLGIIGALDEGFIHLEKRDFAIKVNYYLPNGRRQNKFVITQLYPAG